MKRPFLLLLLLFLALLVGCQAQQPEPVMTEVAQPAPTEVPATETPAPAPTDTAVPPATATEVVEVPTETPAATPTDTATPTTEAPLTSGFLCSEIARPALALFLPGEGYQITNPLTGASCQTTLGGDVPGSFQATGNAVYYTVRENENFVVKQLSADGHQLLPFTAVDVAEAEAFHTFVVSDDSTTLAWAAGAPDGAATVTQMWVGETTTGDAWTPLPPYRFEDTNGSRRVMVPIRFSADNSILYYTLQPYGIGGAWNAFVGRYDNLYALRLKSEAPPELVFDCDELRVTLCLGDFFVVDNQVTGLAYINGDNALVIENGAGEVLNTIEVDAGYVAYPTWGPGGEMVFYAADIEDTAGSPQPAEATIYRVAPPTAPAEALASDPGLLPAQAWLDGTHAVVGYSQDDSWGTAVVDVNGGLQVVESAPDANFMEVLPPARTVAPSTLGEATRYVDETAGVALLYPSGWSVLDVDPAAKEESIAYAVSFFSWEPEAAGQGGIPEGETKFDLVIISDTNATSLEEAIAERRAQMAEMEPPETILVEQRMRLSNGLEAVRWLVESRGEQAVVYLTFVDGRMIMLSGLGDFPVIDAIAQTLETIRAE